MILFLRIMFARFITKFKPAKLEVPFPQGTLVVFPKYHTGYTKGRVILYVPGHFGYKAYYVIDVGGPERLKIPSKLVKPDPSITPALITKPSNQ